MNIVYFSPINWDFLKQRPQHIAEELSKYHSVYYIEPSISGVSSIIRGKKFHKSREFNVNINLKIIRPGGKLRLPRIFDLVDFTGLNLVYEKFYLKKVIENAHLIWLGSPIYYDLVKDFGKKIIYDKMDDYEKLTKNIFVKRLIKRNEKNLLSKAMLTFTSSQFLYNQIELLGKPVALIQNGLDRSLCSNSNNDKQNKVAYTIKEIKKNCNVIFGYIGTIDHWFDYEAIKQIVQHNKKNVVVMVGHNNLSQCHHDNIYYFDAVSKNELNTIIKEFDYCLYTFKRNELLDSINPVKIYEYLSFNKKIIAVDSVETRKFKNCINLYDNYKTLKELLNELDNMKTPFNNDQLIRFINDNSWDKRTALIIEHMNNIMTP